MSSESAESVHDEVPCDPELTRCFSCLQIIDEFRYQNDASLIDELMLRWLDAPSESRSSVNSQYIDDSPNGEDGDNLLQKGDAEEDLQKFYNLDDVNTVNSNLELGLSSNVKSKLSTILE